MFIWLSASWWDGVSGIASVITLGTVLAAVIEWIRGRHRVMGAYLNLERHGTWVDKKRGIEGDLFTIRNVGGSVALIQFIRGKDLKEDTCWIKEEKDEQSNMLAPGNGMRLHLMKTGENPELIVIYTSHRDSSLVNFERFQCKEATKGETLALDAYVAPPFRARRASRYRGGQLFHGGGITSCHRWVHLSNRKGPELIQEAAEWIDAYAKDAQEHSIDN